ncbi:MAG: tol-pal system protein YbgF [Rhodobacteraceae bacterium]|nr:tol-pal system protein YbgF [Paracoccaceae bacterium]
MIGIRGIAILFLVLGIAQFAADPSSAQLFGKKKDDSAVRITQLEEQIRQLTGQLEQLNFQLIQTQEMLNRMQEDNEFRFQQLEGTSGNGKRSEAPAKSEPGGVKNLAESVVPDAAGTGAMDWETDDKSVADLGAGADGPMDLSALANGESGAFQSNDPLRSDGTFGTGSDFAGLSITGDPRTDYDTAYSMAVSGEYIGAEEGFRAFLETYPDHNLVPNAQFWLGESLLAQQDYRGAADAFLKTYTEYPDNSKRPDSLLKLGVSLQGLGEQDAACATFSELLNKFPSAAPAVLSQAREERSQANCS